MRRFMKVDRSDYVIVQALLAIAALAVLGTAVASPLVDWLRGRPLAGLASTGATGSALPASQTLPGAHAAWDGTVRVEVADPSAGLRLLDLLPGVLLGIAAIVVVALLARILAGVRAGRPFGTTAVRDLQRLAGTMLVAAFVVPLAAAAADHAILRAALADPPPLGYEVATGWLLAGLLIGILAEVFATGHRLADDVEGLV